MQERPETLRYLKAIRQPKDIKAGMLESIPWLMDLPYKQIRDLAYYLEGYRLRKGNILFSEGDREPYLVIIVDGTIEIIKMDSQQNPQLVAILREGKVFGEMSLLDGEPRSAQAQAREEVTIFVLTQERYKTLQKVEPVIALNLTLKMAKSISQKLRQTTGQWVDLVNEKKT
jgi:CRP-like cAMP-binding protein